jgi:hypothetical protein
MMNGTAETKKPCPSESDGRPQGRPSRTSERPQSRTTPSCTIAYGRLGHMPSWLRAGSQGRSTRGRGVPDNRQPEIPLRPVPGAAEPCRPPARRPPARWLARRYSRPCDERHIASGASEAAAGRGAGWPDAEACTPPHQAFGCIAPSATVAEPGRSALRWATSGWHEPPEKAPPAGSSCRVGSRHSGVRSLCRAPRRAPRRVPPNTGASTPWVAPRPVGHATAEQVSRSWDQSRWEF